MFHRRHKTVYFVLEGLNALAASIFFNYLFFYMRAHFGFGNKENLLLTTMHGLLYMTFAAFGGRVGQKRGYFFALRLGFGTMGLGLALGGLAVAGWGAASPRTLYGLIAALALWTFGMCFTWPALEAMTSERETRSGLQQMIGVYNLVWATAAALAYFGGGALVTKLGWGAMFWLPFGIHATQLVLLAWLGGKLHQEQAVPLPEPVLGDSEPAPVTHSPAETSVFLRLAWLANPLAYIAMNALLPVIPQMADHLGMSTMTAGFICSVWLFSRMVAFLGLWLWNGWHYRFGWLVTAYVSLIVSFALILLVPSVAAIVAGQVLFGLAVGLLYYSSLFYSMDLGDTKGEHGGLHEAAIGAGIFGGPAIGVAALQLSPSHPQAGVWAVSAVLTVGLGVMVWIKACSARNGAGIPEPRNDPSSPPDNHTPPGAAPPPGCACG